MRKNLEAENRDNVMKHSCIKAITGVYGTISINLCEMLGYCEGKYTRDDCKRR